MIKLRQIISEGIETGRPFHGVVYRGDDEKFGDFDYRFIGKATGVNTVGFWFTSDPDAAQFYGEHVRAFEINIRNPLVVSADDFINSFPNGPTYFARKALNAGYDGVIFIQIHDGDRVSDIFCVFNKNQISAAKS